MAALELATGRPVWVRTGIGRTDWISSTPSPAGADGKVVVGFLWQKNLLNCFDARTGHTLWSIQAVPGEGPSSTVSTPTIDSEEGCVYFNRHSGHLCKVSLESGEVIWSHSIAGARWNSSPPSLTPTLAVVGTADGRLLAVDRKTGEKVWGWEQPGPSLLTSGPYIREQVGIFGGSVTNDDLALFTTGMGTLTAVSLKDGRQLWSVKLPGPAASQPAVQGERIYVADLLGNLTCLGWEQLE